MSGTRTLKTLVFLVETPFSERYRRMFGVDFFLSQGLRVVVADVTPVTRPGCGQTGQDAAGGNRLECRTFFSVGELRKLLQGLQAEETLLINYVSYKIRSFTLFRCIATYGFEYCIHCSTFLPLRYSSWESIAAKLSSVGPGKVLDRLLGMIGRKRLGTSYPRFLLVTGGDAFAAPPAWQGTAEILLHNFDYDSYLAANRAPVEGKYAVFLDANMPFHSDIAMLGMKMRVGEDSYFNALKRLFRIMGQDTGMKVCVAPHPRGDTTVLRRCYAPFPLGNRSTIDLVRNAGLVIAHHSTAITYAVLYKKPMLIVTTEDLISTPVQGHIEALCRFFGVKMTNAHEGANAAKNIIYPSDRYDQFAARYIKSPRSAQGFYWEIFLSKIREMGEWSCSTKKLS